jgi:hypothetical protein
MATWNTQFEDSGCWKKLEELDRELIRIRSHVPETTTQLEQYSKLNDLSTVISRVKNNLNPSLVSNSFLQKIENGLESVVVQLRGKNESEISPALEAACRAFDQLPLEFVFYSTTCLDSLKSSEVKIDAAVDLVRLLEEKITAQSTKLTELQSFLDQKKVEVANLKESITQNFTALEISEKEKFVETVQDLNQQGTQTLITIESKLKEAEKIVGVIGNIGMAGGYQKTANEERIAKWVWQAIASGSLVLLIYFATTHISGITDLNQLVPRFLVATSFIALASYAGMQGERHRKSEMENRKLELGIASIDPFLSNLQPAERDKLKESLIHKLFEQAPESSNLQTGIPETNIDLLERVKKLFST